MRRSHRPACLLLLAVAALSAAAADNARDVYRSLGIAEKDVITGTVLTAQLVESTGRQIVGMVTYFTGARDKGEAVNVRLAVFQRRGEELVELYSRDYGRERGGFVARGDLQLLDLDRDGLHEIVVTYDNVADPVVHERIGEVIYLSDEGFRVGWTGAMEYDATRSARGVSEERRDRYVREIAVRDTMKARGVTLFLDRTIYAVAGERLAEPKVVRETYPLKPSRTDW